MEIKTGASVTKKWVVSYDMTAKAIKEGAAEVFSTPCMVSLMEDSCCDAIAQFLDEGYISVGISVNIRHLPAHSRGQRNQRNRYNQRGKGQ